MERTRLTFACLTAALLVALVGSVCAEDDPLAPPPADEGAAPAPPKTPERPAKPAAPKDAGKAPAPEKPASAGGWGTPDASPTRDVATDLLPPPIVRDPKTGATTGGSARTASRVATTPPLDLPPDAMPVAPDAAGVDPALIPLDLRPATPSASAPAAPAPAAATIESVAKVHNVKLGDGSAALRLDVGFEAIGQQGRDLFLAAGFVRADTGTPLRSVIPAFAGRSGTVVARTEPVRVMADGRYRASLWVPYGAFPAPAAGRTYQVRAIVQLLRREGEGRETVRSHTSTTFTVHGPR